jgi:hypothetical protein
MAAARSKKAAAKDNYLNAKHRRVISHPRVQIEA